MKNYKYIFIKKNKIQLQHICTGVPTLRSSDWSFPILHDLFA